MIEGSKPAVYEGIFRRKTQNTICVRDDGSGRIAALLGKARPSDAMPGHSQARQKSATRSKPARETKDRCQRETHRWIQDKKAAKGFACHSLSPLPLANPLKPYCFATCSRASLAATSADAAPQPPPSARIRFTVETAWVPARWLACNCDCNTCRSLSITSR